MLKRLTGPPITFTVALDQPQFCAGQAITGTVVAESRDGPEGTKAKALTIQLKGHEYCLWTEEEGSGDNRHTRTYRGNNTIIEVTLPIWSPEPGTDSGMFPSGHSEYRFAFPVLPETAPASSTVTSGFIRYDITVNLDIPWARNGSTSTVATVVRSSRLQMEKCPTLQRNGQTSITPGCCCCSAGVIGLTASLTQDSPNYVSPGGQVEVQFGIDNNSSRAVKLCSVNLLMLVTLRASARTRAFPTTVTSLPAIEQPLIGKTSTDGKVVLMIPQSVILSNGGHVCEVSHQIVVTASPSCAFSKSVRIPIEVGVPTTNVQVPETTQTVQQQPYFSEPSGAETVSPPVTAAAGGTFELSQVESSGDAIFVEMLKVMEAAQNKKDAGVEFARDHSGMKPSPDELRQAMLLVFSLYQEEFISGIASHLDGITCQHVAVLLEASSFSAKRSVLQSMASRITDLENRHVILDQASMLDKDEYEKILNSL